MKRSVEVMEILEAFDLTGSYRAAAALSGSDHKTVARYVRERDRGRAPGEAAQRRKRTDPFLAKLEEWIERSRGRLRADVAHRKLQDLGYTGSERTTRRAVARAKHAYAASSRHRGRVGGRSERQRIGRLPPGRSRLHGLSGLAIQPA